MKKADIALIGLAVMGENLVMNMESKGFTVAVYNRTTEKVKHFVEGRAAGKNIIGCYSIEDLIANLEKPRKVFMMVKAGAAVDALIEQLLPFLEEGDILIDGGNSQFPDTVRRTAYVEGKGLLYIGCGVSGGEEGALNGPSMMPGGSPAAWPFVRPIFQSICAKVENGVPCCDWVGENGAGHFAKMVHNGIEYGDMQLICEAYQLMRDGLGMSAEEMHAAFIESIRKALYASKIISYAKGYTLMRTAAKTYGWNLNYGGIALMWREGLYHTQRVPWKNQGSLRTNPALENLLLDDYFAGTIKTLVASWREVVAYTVKAGIPMPAFTSALNYFDGYTTACLPANLLQAQRDYFGAHTYERVDQPRVQFYHTNWTGHGGSTAAGTYNA